MQVEFIKSTNFHKLCYFLCYRELLTTYDFLIKCLTYSFPSGNTVLMEVIISLWENVERTSGFEFSELFQVNVFLHFAAFVRTFVNRFIYGVQASQTHAERTALN